MIPKYDLIFIFIACILETVIMMYWKIISNNYKLLFLVVNNVIIVYPIIPIKL